MDTFNAKRIVVLGLGNLIRSDDGVGLCALRELEQDPRLPPDVTLVEGGTKGLELLPYISDASCLLVLDAMDVGAAAGTVFRIAKEELHSMPGNGNVHELALADLLNALRIMGREIEQIVLLGIQPLTTELGTALSTPVQQALPSLVEGALIELSQWTLAEKISINDVIETAEKSILISTLEA